MALGHDEHTISRSLLGLERFVDNLLEVNYVVSRFPFPVLGDHTICTSQSYDYNGP
jgi:hypothetical protein